MSTFDRIVPEIEGIALEAARIASLALIAVGGDPTRAIAELERAGERIDRDTEIDPVSVAQGAINEAAQVLGR